MCFLHNTTRLVELIYVMFCLVHILLLMGVANEVPPPLRQLLLGVAGTGKSYVMKCNRNFYRMFCGEQAAERSMAPTGKSAGGIGGVTLDSGMGFTMGNIRAIVLAVSCGYCWGGCG